MMGEHVDVVCTMYVLFKLWWQTGRESGGEIESCDHGVYMYIL